jgi:hypothetical protein
MARRASGRRVKKPRLLAYTEAEDDTVEYLRHRVYGIQSGDVVLQSTQFISSSPPMPLPPELPEIYSSESGIDSWHEFSNEPALMVSLPSSLEVPEPTIEPSRKEKRPVGVHALPQLYFNVLAESS